MLLIKIKLAFSVLETALNLILPSASPSLMEDSCPWKKDKTPPLSPYPVTKVNIFKVKEKGFVEQTYICQNFSSGHKTGRTKPAHFFSLLTTFQPEALKRIRK